MNFSFAGCGFLGIYHVGVSACLKKYAPNLLVNKISGASAGALAAVCLLCDSPLGIITSSVLKTATEARRRTLGPFSPTFNIEKLLKEGLLNVLPDDAHKIVSGKLFISVTRVSDGKNILLSQFDSREELIQALICSAFIPGFSGWVCPKVQGIRYVDGGFSDNLPEMDQKTITVSPFCGEADICPKDSTPGLMTINLANTSIELSKENLYRFTRILFPPPPYVLNKMCQQGFNDALDFLQRNNLINCTRCLAVQSRFNLKDSQDYAHDVVPVHEMACLDCHQQRKEAIIDQLPEAVGCILQDAINKANQGLMNWVFKHKSMKLLSILTLPYILPIDVAYAAFLKFIGSAPTVSDIKSLANQIIALVQALIKSSKLSPLHQHRHESRFSCQLAITQFSGDMEMQHLHNRQSFDFTLDLDDMKGVPQSHKDAMQLESQALTEVALRCASRSVSRAGSRIASRAASRAVSRAVSRRPSLNDLSDPSLYDGANEILLGQISDDAFEQILDVTTHQEALMAYYYLDDNNEVQVTEIFDLTKDESNEGVDGGGIEMVNSHWDLQREMQAKSWPLNMRNDSIGSEQGFDGDLNPTVVSDTESEHYHR
ncbi:1-acylglycerol-3-phosphate O-acyltransferase Pnpla3 isoform X5 [Cherax quadricarinatus]|uniref:1-acylglycerol-3-phosphate O-acyltransferase Pnpla3 isoform X5 n=1 Tax=Cherax quadricarinatus TaxID=27406 RepID=UPI002378A091|nr:1-acylglycerol-3-phosphate O-acyltransferase Pnpla3-like isoform X7 [Cherax quadricarinatus]